MSASTWIPPWLAELNQHSEAKIRRQRAFPGRTRIEADEPTRDGPVVERLYALVQLAANEVAAGRLEEDQVRDCLASFPARFDPAGTNDSQRSKG